MISGFGSVRVTDRIDTLDVLRGVAICGILLMNIPEMGLIATKRPAYPTAWNVDWICWAVQTTLFNGTMRGLFTMLFGAGMVLMLRRAEGDDAQATPIDVWLRRCLALTALGIVNWLVLFWPGEILWDYGLTGCALLAFRTMRPRTLVIAASLCLTVLTATDAVQSYRTDHQLQVGIAAEAARSRGKPLDDAQREAMAALNAARETLHPTPKIIADEREQRTHLAGLIGWSWKTWSSINLTDIGWGVVLESLSSMLLGMTLYRTGVLTGQASRRAYLSLVVVGYAVGLGLRLLNLYVGARIGFGFPTSPDQVGLAVFTYADFEIARLFVTLGHIGVVVLAFRSGFLGKAMVLRALGRMALTTYLAQSILTSLLFYGFGLVGRFGFAQLMLLAMAIWAMTGTLCVLWLRRHEMGPAETLLRAFAYQSFRHGKRQRQADAALKATPAI
jgi:uncharacterized protein